VGGCIDAAATTVEEVVLKPGTTYAKRDSQPKREREKSWDQLARLLAFFQTRFPETYKSDMRPCDAVDECIAFMKQQELKIAHMEAKLGLKAVQAIEKHIAEVTCTCHASSLSG
jgi:hypothetical protein